MRLFALALVAATLGGCDKGEKQATSGSAGSGPMTAEEARVFELLPGDANIVMGGNYIKAQNLMASMSPMMDKLGPGMGAWGDCFAAFPSMRMGGVGALSGAGFELRIVMDGVTIDQIETCANKAAFQVSKDEDGAYIAVEMTMAGQTTRHGYVRAANGSLYSRQQLALGNPTPIAASRAELEADLAAVADKPKVLDNPRIKELAAKVDRSKTVWVVGLGAGTPIAGKLDEAYGTFDMSSGLAADVSLLFGDSTLAKRVADNVKQAKQQAPQMPAELRPVIEKLVIEHAGNRVRIAASMTQAQLKSFFSMPGLMGR